jgi:hypothetical protein
MLRKLSFLSFIVCLSVKASIIPYPKGDFAAEVFLLEDTSLYSEWMKSVPPIVKNKVRFRNGDSFTLSMIFSNPGIDNKGQVKVSAAVRGINPDGSVGFQLESKLISENMRPRTRNSWYLTPVRLDLKLDGDLPGYYSIEVDFHDHVRDVKKTASRKYEVFKADNDSKVEDAKNAVELYEFQPDPKVMLREGVINELLLGKENDQSVNLTQESTMFVPSATKWTASMLDNKASSGKISNSNTFPSTSLDSQDGDGMGFFSYAVPICMAIILLVIVVKFKWKNDSEG